MSQGCDLDAWGSNLFIPNMVMWHIKLKGMVSRTGYKYNFYPRVKLVALGWGQKVKYHSFQLQGQFQRFLYQTLRVFSQIKDT